MHNRQITFEFNSWEPRPERFELTAKEIHVWRVDLDDETIILPHLQETLSTDEKTRAGRFHFDRDRNHFAATRGILRELLGRYLNRAPADIEFDYGPRGKPTLSGAPSLQFNVSHSRGMALLAFAFGCQLGVDVEKIRPFAGEKIAERFFSPQEVMELRRLPEILRDEGFFLCWTRKEAYIKARGEGLHVPLKSFHVSLTPGESERLETTDELDWTLRSLRPAADYVGAVVAEGKGWSLRGFDWTSGGG